MTIRRMKFKKIKMGFYIKEGDEKLRVVRRRLRTSDNGPIKRIYLFENLYIWDRGEMVSTPYESKNTIKELDEFTKYLGLSYVIEEGKNISWTKESAFKHAKSFNKFRDFDRNAAGCYKYLNRNGWLDEATKHMERGKQTLWTMAKLKKIALKNNTRSKLYKAERGAYNRALKDGVLDILYP